MSGRTAGGRIEPMTQQAEPICMELREQTRRILEAAGREDFDAIGAAIARRKDLLAQLAAVKRERPAEMAGCQPLLMQTAGLDARAGQAVKALRERVEQELSRRRRSYGPLLRYGSSRFSTTAGMVLDRKD